MPRTAFALASSCGDLASAGRSAERNHEGALARPHRGERDLGAAERAGHRATIAVRGQGPATGLTSDAWASWRSPTRTSSTLRSWCSNGNRDLRRDRVRGPDAAPEGPTRRGRAGTRHRLWPRTLGAAALRDAAD